MRARNIKPGFFLNEELRTVDAFTRLLFIGLWCYADRDGRFDWKLHKIKASIFPYDDVPIDVMMCNLMSLHLIAKVGSVGHVLNFLKHQHPHPHEPKSSLEALPENYEQIQCHGMSLHVIQCQEDIRIKDSLIPDSLIPDSLIPIVETIVPHRVKKIVKIIAQPPPVILGSVGDQTGETPTNPTGEPTDETAPTKKQMTADRQEACRKTWNAYAEAYSQRYGTDPVRNARVNAQVVSFCKRIPCEEAPSIATHYVLSNLAFYVDRGHQFANLLHDAEKLRTEWATGHIAEGRYSNKQRQRDDISWASDL